MIKYHDNTTGTQYGPDGHLTDNWDANANFPEDSYIKAYFRIDCPAYNFATGFESAESRELFFAEVRGILNRFDIFEGTGGRFDGFPMEHLHIHPQELSGVVAKRKAKQVAEALNDCQTCKCRWVDLYGDISTIGNDDFRAILDAKRGEITADILEMFKTKRSNLYIVPGYSTFDRVIAKYHVPRREAERATDDGIARNYVVAVFNDMASAGQLVSAKTKNGTGYRTAKRGEVKTA